MTTLYSVWTYCLLNYATQRIVWQRKLTTVNIISARLKTCEDLVASYGARLGDVERAQHTMEAQIATLQVSLSAPRAPAPAAAPAVTATSLSDVILELDLRVSKKTNIVLSGVLSAPPVSDATLATNLLRDELGINATVTRCVRLGKPSADINRPCRLFVTLSSDLRTFDAHCAIMCTLMQTSRQNSARMTTTCILSFGDVVPLVRLTWLSGTAR
jgi:hypothetical protein